ncbi:MAG: hypothetical protein ACWA41_06365 [Putridiphycobacter sp.]
MKINSKYNGTILGGIFTVGSFLLTFTFFVPILSILPGVLVEYIVSKLINNSPYSNVGKWTIIILFAILLMTIIFIFNEIRKKQLSNKDIISIMVLEYFIFHSLGFYLYWAIALNFKGDGQLVFGAISSFPLSSLGFVMLGVLIDLFKVKSENEL